jgi:class 3 adenylate cyclase
MINYETAIYKDRFENAFRVAKKITSCLNISDILEIIRDEVKITIPHSEQACLILIDPDAPDYMRPLHCTAEKRQVNCRMCKRGRDSIQKALAQPTAFPPGFESPLPAPVIAESVGQRTGETAFPIFDRDKPLAVLSVVTQEGHVLTGKDMILLGDLVELATNTIINGKKYSQMLKEKLTLERIMGHIKTFVPETVQRIVEKNPDAPELNRQDLDVSVLFLDVADYTRISESLTQDKVNFIIEKYFSCFLDVICSHGGDVNETAGDGLMAIFQGDKKENSLNAAAAALEIRRRTGEINKELEGLFYPLNVNMGVNSGTASVGMSRFAGASGTRTTFTASGPVTNLASRIASAATDGDILVGPETASRIQDEITLFGRGLMTFKNIRQQVAVFSLVSSC